MPSRLLVSALLLLSLLSTGRAELAAADLLAAAQRVLAP